MTGKANCFEESGAPDSFYTAVEKNNWKLRHLHVVGDNRGRSSSVGERLTAEREVVGSISGAELIPNRPLPSSKTLTFKMRLGGQPFLWKWVLFAWEWKIISISKAEHLPSFWRRGLGELGNGLFNLVPRVLSLSNMADAAAILESEKTLGTRLWPISTFLLTLTLKKEDFFSSGDVF